MSEYLNIHSRRQSRRRSLALCGVFATALLWPGLGISAEGGPFKPFLGNWRGGGTLTSSDGHDERIGCRATYTGSDDNSSLEQSLVCAGDSYRFNIQCHAVARDGNLQGNWQETTRNAGGELSGQIRGGDFVGTVTGSGFTAQVSLRVRGHKQVVEIRPSGGDITSVKVSLSR